MTTIAPERWLPVPGWEGRYEVSDHGNVRSLHHKWGPRTEPLLLKPKNFAQDGRSRVTLYQGSPRTPVTRLVHQLVLEAFTGPCPLGMEARHGPGGMLDNRLINLCWGTHSANVGPDKIRDGTLPRGERHWKARLTVAIVREIRRRAAAGESQRSLAREFGVTQTSVSKIVRRQAWRHVGDL